MCNPALTFDWFETFQSNKFKGIYSFYWNSKTVVLALIYQLLPLCLYSGSGSKMKTYPFDTELIWSGMLYHITINSNKNIKQIVTHIGIPLVKL